MTPHHWHLISNRWNSAITEYALSCARALAARGHPTVFSPLSGSPAERRAREAGLDVRPFPSFALGGLPAFLRHIHEIQPSLVYTYGGPETTLASFARVMGRVPQVVRFRGLATPALSTTSVLRHRLGHFGVDAFLSPGRRLSGMLLPFAGVRPVHSVTLGIDTAIYQPRGVFPGQSSRPEILVVGRFDPVKGHAKLMSMFRGVLAAWPHNVLRPRLHILGEEANLTMADLEAAAREHSLSPEDCVISCRRHPNIAEAMTAATIGCVPSLGSEIICRVAEEFLLCGTPVAVSGVGSLDEVLFPTAGMSYRALDHATATQRLYELLWNAWHETPTMRAQRAAEARARFSLEAMADNLGASHLF